MASMASVDGGYLSVLPGLLVLGVGVGLTMTPGTTAITGSLPVDEQGVASALNDTVRELGGALGVALIGSVLSAAYSSSVADATAALPPEAADRRCSRASAAPSPCRASSVPRARRVLDAARLGVRRRLGGVDVDQRRARRVAAALFALVWTPSRRDEFAARRWAAPTTPSTWIRSAQPISSRSRCRWLPADLTGCSPVGRAGRVGRIHSLHRPARPARPGTTSWRGRRGRSA